MSQVKDIIDGIKHRLPDRVNIYPALNRAVRMISKRLFYHKASMIQGALSVTISADSSSGSMPLDYWALMGKPYISGKTYFLEPVPDPSVKLTLNTNSTPQFYEMKGSTIHLYPGTSSEITIAGDYWTKPTKLSKPTDTMPFNELFDDAIQEALILVYAGGNSMPNFINQAVDEIVPELDMAAPKRFEDSLNLDCMTNEGWL